MAHVLRWSRLICWLSFAALAHGCKDAPRTTLRVSVNSWVGFGPLFVAKKEGLFQKHGLDVDIVKIESSSDRRAALAADRIDILGSTLDDLAVGLSQGVEGRAFACADFSNGGDGILGHGAIDNLSKLVSEPIAVQPGFVNHFFLLYVLDSRKIPTDSLQLIAMTPDDAGAAFIAGRINAAVTWEPFLSQAIEKRPGTHILARSDSFPEAIVDLFVAKRAWLEAHAAQAGAFKAAWDEGLTFIEANRDSAMVTIAAEIGVAPEDAAGMLSGAKLLNSDQCVSMLTPKLPLLTQSVKRLWTRAGYITKDIDLQGAVQLGPGTTKRPGP